MAKKKLTNEEVRIALENARGLKTLAADALGVSFPTIERYIKASVMLQETVQTARRKRTEMAKSKLDEAIMRGESWAVMFTLKNKVDPDAEFVGDASRVDVTTGGEKLGKDDGDTRAEILRKLDGIAAATGAGSVPKQTDGE